MQIAALDTDVLSDGSGKAHITWIAKELLATTHNMNSTSINANGWATSKMRTYLQNDVWALIPTNVQNAVVAVDKTYYDYGTKSTKNCSDKVWIPSSIEVFGQTGEEDSGVFYSELFTNAKSRIKTLDGSAATWWLRSASTSSNDAFFSVGSYGYTGTSAARYTYGVVLSFCF